MHDAPLNDEGRCIILHKNDIEKKTQKNAHVPLFPSIILHPYGCVVACPDVTKPSGQAIQDLSSAERK